jgi:hypothetical protein
MDKDRASVLRFFKTAIHDGILDDSSVVDLACIWSRCEQGKLERRGSQVSMLSQLLRVNGRRR